MTHIDPHTPGNPLQADELFGLVYQELRQIAHRCLRRDWGNNTWQTTDLLHEAWLKLAKYQGHFKSRAHFLAVAARCMRNILVDYARKKNAEKRDGDWQQVSLSETLAVPVNHLERLSELNDGLNELQKIDEQEFRIVEMYYFGAMQKTEIAQVLGVSESTVRRRLKSAQAWLLRQLEAGAVHKLS